MPKANTPVEPVAPEVEPVSAPEVEPVAPEAPKQPSKSEGKRVAAQKGSVLEETLKEAESLLKTLKENKSVVGSDIALREIDASIAKAEEIALAIQRGLLADK